MYRAGADGALHILRFAIENWWICEMESVDLGQPSKNTIQALEASEILHWKKEDLDALCLQLPAFGALCHQLTTRNQHMNQQRIFANLSFTAEEKYQDFLTTYPEIFNRVPLHMIASYLGMTRKTISRIRAGHRV
jgi:CRP-like cAMP-binding protein